MAARTLRPTGRQYCVARDGARLTFECPQGHRFIENFGPDAPPRKRIAPIMIARFARYWSRENGGCTGVCPACRRAERRAEQRRNAR